MDEFSKVLEVVTRVMPEGQQHTPITNGPASAPNITSSVRRGTYPRCERAQIMSRMRAHLALTLREIG
jgi:hypothetical protein